ncbi:MAG: hypothetical protein AAFU85_21380 [Planctomycetota bacterium]
MSSQPNNALLELTVELRDLYRELDATVDSMQVGSVEALDQIGDKMKLIQATESRLGPLREVFQQTNSTLPGALREPTDQTIDLLKGLLPKLAQLEKATIDSFQRLFPKIQESVRAVKMQNAYAQQAS